jgi:hypothetical protein
MPIAIELKSIKLDQRASEETYAYSAKLFVDGVHVCDVANDGRGGCDRMVGPGKGIAYGDAHRLYDEACRRVTAEMPKQNLADPGEPENLVEDSMDFLCARLVTRDILAKKAARDVKRTVMFFKEGLPADGARAPIYSFRLDGDPQRLYAHIRTKHPEAWILNEHPMEEIVKAYERSE